MMFICNFILYRNSLIERKKNYNVYSTIGSLRKVFYINMFFLVKGLRYLFCENNKLEFCLAKMIFF